MASEQKTTDYPFETECIQRKTINLFDIDHRIISIFLLKHLKIDSKQLLF